MSGERRRPSLALPLSIFFEIAASGPNFRETVTFHVKLPLPCHRGAHDLIYSPGLWILRGHSQRWLEATAGSSQG